MSTPVATSDVINHILGVEDESPLGQLRSRKPTLVQEVQEYYDALFDPAPESAAALPVRDRALVAARVASHTASTAAADWYARLATANGADEALIERARAVGESWPDPNTLGAAMRHADLLTLRPAAATPGDIQALKEAGYTPAGIVALSQVIAFVSYQVRLVAGLRAIGGQR